MLSVIIPTYNERKAVRALVERVRGALRGIPYELVFVDDSTDGTDAVIAELARTDERIRLLHRTERRGLATAVVEGIRVARGDVVCVLDADLQHPPERIPDLLRALEETEAEVVVASRYLPGGSYRGLSPLRRLASRAATGLARLLLRRARLVSDPMSGFFAFRRSVVEGAELQPVGYKILLEILVRGRFRRVAEVPYGFEVRAAGQSKLSWRQNLEYLRHLVRLLPANPEDLRFVRFGLVGASGIGVNTAALWGLVRLGVHYRPAGALAIAAAITWNFLWNDAFTWRDRRSRDLATKLRRYLQYWAVTGVGSALQYALYLVLTAVGLPYLLSNLVGIGVAVGWNYRMHGSWTWKPTEPAITRVVYRPT
ncbi:MAG: glycosyltransferase family 2 protein [Armatimonadetes bacterium]|nr:glycosyltransferase family 2 protein [Armatimonadota bacterium]MDW8153901.1 glycosyltransferase family 2 protein [Armatimonadota bacterium]